MNHSQSIATKATERYLLGELLPREREAFEQHYFECPQCANDVCTATELAAGAREFFRHNPVWAPGELRQTAVRTRRSWFAFPAGLPAAAAFALLTITVYQNAMVIPALRSAATDAAAMQVLPSAVLVPASRSTLPSLTVAASAKFFQLSLELPPTMASGTYGCDLRDQAGRSIWTVPVSVRDAADGLSLLIPAGRLASGSYDLVLKNIDSRQSTEVNPFRFRLERR